MDAGSIVLVTGGTGHLGQAVVDRMLADGATVITTYVEDEEWETVRESHDTDRLHGYKTDVTADAQVEGLIEKVVEEHGRIDALLHLVGAWRGGDEMHEVDEDTWDLMLDVNLKSAFLMLRHVLPRMREQGYGRIVCIGSKTGHDLPAEGGPYAIAKHGLESLTRIVSKEQKGDITMNCVMPSVIDTPVTRENLGAATAKKGVTPAAVADVIADTIAGDDTGQSIPVYGELGE